MRTLVLVLLLSGVAGTVRADELASLSNTVETDPSEKARIAATVALGKLADRRALGTLIRALGDRSNHVRGLAASALGHLRDARAVPALEKTLADPDDGVRARARDALGLLRDQQNPRAAAAPPPAVPTRVQMAPRESPRRNMVRVRVGAMGVRAISGQHLTGRMRELVVSQLSGAPGVALEDGDGELIVDGSITKMSREANGPWIETICEVKLTVSSSTGGLLSIVSGGATVQTARGAWSRRLEPNLQAEALDNAVRGLQANLFSLLEKHGGIH